MNRVLVLLATSSTIMACTPDDAPVEPPAGEVRAPVEFVGPACACSKMRVAVTNKSKPYCLPSNTPLNLGQRCTAASPAQAQAAQSSGLNCPPNHSLKVCDLDRQGPVTIPNSNGMQTIYFGFEVEADLTGQAQSCPEGQLAAGTTGLVTVNGQRLRGTNPPVASSPTLGQDVTLPYRDGNVVFTPTAANNRYPDFFGATPPDRGTTYGPDNFTKAANFAANPPTDILKLHLNSTVRWIDFPNQSLTERTGQPPQNVDISRVQRLDRFVSFVKGANGGDSCWCEFDVKYSWDSTNGFSQLQLDPTDPGQPYFTVVRGHNCPQAPI